AGGIGPRASPAGAAPADGAARGPPRAARERRRDSRKLRLGRQERGHRPHPHRRGDQADGGTRTTESKAMTQTRTQRVLLVLLVLAFVASAASADAQMTGAP